MSHRVLVVGGTDADRERAQQALTHGGHQVDLVANGADAFEQLMALPYDLVVTDCCMEKLDCPAMVKKVRGLGVRTPILIWSASIDSAALEESLQATGGSHVDKNAGVEALVEKVGAVLAGDARPAGQVATPASAPAPKVEAQPKGGILLIDQRIGEAEALHALLPSSLCFASCESANQGLAHAHDHKFDLVLFSTETQITNLTGTIAQLHLLLKEGFVVGVATPVRGASPQAAVNALRDFDFDEVILKPFSAAVVARLVSRYCSPWNELVVVTGDLVLASARTSRKESYKEFVSMLRGRLEDGVRSLIDACFDSAVVDVSAVDCLSPMDLAETLRRLNGVGAPFGLKARFVTSATQTQALRKVEGSFGWDPLPLYASAEAARAAKA
jgi:DNA-binding NtrC family response regulator